MVFDKVLTINSITKEWFLHITLCCVTVLWLAYLKQILWPLQFINVHAVFFYLYIHIIQSFLYGAYLFHVIIYLLSHVHVKNQHFFPYHIYKSHYVKLHYSCKNVIFFFYNFTYHLTLILLELKVISLCHQYRARPASTPVQSDQAVYCWLTNFKSSSWYPEKW